MRNLASIQEIAWKRPIEGKDRIELCGVLGWTVITKKDEFQAGDKCVYVEIDSVLPEKPEFEFLRSKNFRIKTMKMAGVYSQGICFPLSILPQNKDYVVGEDVTDIMGIKQYEPTMDIETVVMNDPKRKPSFLDKYFMRYGWYRRVVKGHGSKIDCSFPVQYVSKTEEIRCQSIPWVLDDKEKKWVVTEKIDGSSGTFLLIKHKHRFKTTYEFKVCSRNKALPKDDGSAYWSVAKKYKLKEKMETVLREVPEYDWIAIQGEVIGPKIQKNKYKVTEPDLYVFNIITSRGGRWSSTVANLMADTLELKFVPIVETEYELPDTIDELLEYATGDSAIGATLREGFVFRSQDGKESFKAVSPKFLMKYDE